MSITATAPEGVLAPKKSLLMPRPKAKALTAASGADAERCSTRSRLRTFRTRSLTSRVGGS